MTTPTTKRGTPPKVEMRIPNVRRPSLPMIIGEACDLAGVTPFDLFGRERSRRLVGTRVAISLVASKWGYSYPEIARAMGKKNHSTPLSAVHDYESGGLLAESREVVGELVAAMMPTDPEPKRLHSQLDGDPALQRKLLDEVEARRTA